MTRAILVVREELEYLPVNSHFVRAMQYLAARLDSAKAGRGQGLVEYAAIIGFIAACMVVAELYLQPAISNALNNVANSFTH